MTYTLSSLENPFAKLRALLGGVSPGADHGDTIDMTIGAPRHAMPDFVGDVLAGSLAGFEKYPMINGTQAFREAIEHWVVRRYPVLSGQISADEHILPLCGSREGLFYAPFIAKERRPDLADKKPAILIPNPFYQAYAAGTIAAGCEPVYLPCPAETDFLPDLDAIPEETLARSVAFYLCTPSNPQGAVASKAYLQKAIKLARQFDFMLFGDECYSEIYRDIPPTCLLEAAAELPGEGGFANLLVFNSLSKRSNLPGLRSGFCAGDPTFIQAFSRFRNVAAPQLALPTQAVSVAVWNDETHVEHNRLLYRKKFECADQLLTGKWGYKPIQAGFFLWLSFAPEMDGEAAALKVWKEYGVKLLPGDYLTQEVSNTPNPGKQYVRLALVHDVETTEVALSRIAED